MRPRNVLILVMAAFSPAYQHDADVVMAVSAGVGLLESRTPRNYYEAVTGPDKHHWVPSINKEYKTIEKQDTWVKMLRKDVPQGANIIDSTWAFRIKTDENGKIIEWKSRLAPRGFKQNHGVDFFEVYANTGKYKSMRLGLSLTAFLDNELDQLDIPSAFLNADLEEDVYMKMPQGFEDDRYVLKLNKSLYGLTTGTTELVQYD